MEKSTKVGISSAILMVVGVGAIVFGKLAGHDVAVITGAIGTGVGGTLLLGVTAHKTLLYVSKRKGHEGYAIPFLGLRFENH